MTNGRCKDVRGFRWPECDQDCMAVVFDRVQDLTIALRWCLGMGVVVQAGGAQGVWPKHLAALFDTVYTFEPEPLNFECLAYNCPEAHIHKFQAALGDRRKPVSLTYPEGVRNMGAVAVKGDGDIPVIRIDDLALNRCDFIQLDIEGYEPEALKGATATISRFSPVVMVEDKGLSTRYGYKSGWSAAFLEGYEVKGTINRDVLLVHHSRRM